MLGDVADRRPSSLLLHDTLLSLCARRGALVSGGPSACPAERMRAAAAGPPADPSGPRRSKGSSVLLGPDRKSTRLNSSHVATSDAAFRLKTSTPAAPAA